MPAKGKVTKEVQTIRELAKELEEPDAIMTGEPEDAEQTSTDEPLVEDAHGVIQEVPTPLLTLTLVRRGALLTDIGETVNIPAPAMLKEGERVRVVIYLEA